MDPSSISGELQQVPGVMTPRDPPGMGTLGLDLSCVVFGDGTRCWDGAIAVCMA